MGGKLPYFKWYPADFEVDETVRLMTLEEIGLYTVCLNHSWINGSLPGEPEDIRRALHVDKIPFRRSWPRVSACFPQVNDRRTNPRQEREREHAKTKSEKATNAIRTRYGRSTDVPTDVLPRAYESVSVSSSVVSGDRGAEKGVVIAEDGWEAYIGVFLAAGKPINERDMEKALREWISLDGPTRVTAQRHIERVCREAASHNFIPLPVNHLSGKGWTRAAPERILPIEKPASRPQRGTGRFLERHGGVNAADC